MVFHSSNGLSAKAGIDEVTYWICLVLLKRSTAHFVPGIGCEQVENVLHEKSPSGEANTSYLGHVSEVPATEQDAIGAVERLHATLIRRRRGGQLAG